MKRIVLALCSLALVLSACNKSTDTVPCEPVNITAPATEVFDLQLYISSSGIAATADQRGFFYTIHRSGSGVSPTPCSDVSVSYTLRLTNGTQLEASGGTTFNLSNLIHGWREALPLLGEGGSMTLYLPPSLAYGAQGSGKVPPNAITVFSIDLMKVL